MVATFWTTPIILLSVLYIYWVVVDDYPDGNSVQSFRYRTPEPAEKSPGNRNKVIVILSNKDVRMACLGFSCLNYIAYCNLVWLPAYLYESYGVSVVTASLIACFYPMVGLLARPLGGCLSDVTFGGRRKPLLLIGMSFIVLATIFLASADAMATCVIVIVLLMQGILRILMGKKGSHVMGGATA
jgi:sugar phosphate permease